MNNRRGIVAFARGAASRPESGKSTQVTVTLKYFSELNRKLHYPHKPISLLSAYHVILFVCNLSVFLVLMRTLPFDRFLQLTKGLEKADTSLKLLESNLDIVSDWSM